MIKNITIIGAGTMGRGIAHVFARHGHPVSLYEPNAAVRDSVIDRIRSELRFMADESYIESDEIEAAIQRITVFSDLAAAAAGADYILEACPEDLELKQKLFLELDKLCPPETIFASNTSSLRLSDITALVPASRKSRCMVCHWYNPPHLLPIAELSRFGNMAEDDFKAVYELYVACEKQPICVLKDIPGMIANRLLHAQAREAFYLAEIGAATPEDIDRALKFGPSFRNATTGMLETADMGGLDIWLAAEDNLFGSLNHSDRASDALRSKVAQGCLGIKNGRGFFDYSGDSRERTERNFQHRLIIQLKASKHYEDP